jgi:heme/copper-type cytochrome/quinol oxidase subunit 2
MKNFFLKNPSRLLTVVVVVVALLMAGSAGAQDVTPAAPIQSVDDVFTLIGTIFNILFWLLIVLASVFIIIAAFTYLTAGGDPEKIKTANQKVIYAAVAVVVAVLAKGIPTLTCSLLGTECEVGGL